MAQRALTAGMTMPRKRALFGLLDADGWAWASVKAAIWLIAILLLLGYIPDRAYYLTVGRTVDLGVIAWSPVNFCPPENKTLPCPAPVGGVVPWDPSPDTLALPAARTDGAAVQVGTRVLYIGGTDGTTAQSTVFATTTTGSDNFGPWSDGPALPEPRTDAAVAFVAGSIYVIGGTDADGAPTTTTYALTPDSTTGDLGTWKTVEALTLTEPRTGAAAVATADGLLLIGGSNADGPVATTWKSLLDAQGALGEFKPEAALSSPQTGATAAIEGDYVWLFGGSGPDGPTATVQRGTFGLAAAEGLPENPDEGKVIAWATNPAANLPGPRAGAAAWAANGALYVLGGADADGSRPELYWAVPTTAGDIGEWLHLDVSDLPAGLTGGAPVVLGPAAVVVGGVTDKGVSAASVRANLAPQAPFFRLGLVGATVPGLKIDGEIGQQLGYLNAAGAGTVNFVILIVIGWAFAHKEQASRMVGRVLRRRR